MVSFPMREWGLRVWDLCTVCIEDDKHWEPLNGMGWMWYNKTRNGMCAGMCEWLCRQFIFDVIISCIFNTVPSYAISNSRWHWACVCDIIDIGQLIISYINVRMYCKRQLATRQLACLAFIPMSYSMPYGELNQLAWIENKKQNGNERNPRQQVHHHQLKGNVIRSVQFSSSSSSSSSSSGTVCTVGRQTEWFGFKMATLPWWMCVCGCGYGRSTFESKGKNAPKQTEPASPTTWRSSLSFITPFTLYVPCFRMDAIGGKRVVHVGTLH